MGELRLYAVGIDEMRGVFGAPEHEAPKFREIAQRAYAPSAAGPAKGLIGKLGPIFRRPPAAPVVSRTQPEPRDVDVLLAGAYVPPERVGATWRLLETLVQGVAWGSTLLNLTPQSLDDLDFALARGGVSASVGLRHLLSTSTSVNLQPVQGLTVGWHPHETALAMADAYRAAMPQVKTREQQELVAALVSWLDGFVHWAQVAATLHRPAPDLIGFWAN